MASSWFLALSCLGPWLGIVQEGAPPDPTPEALDAAWSRFCNSLPDVQVEIVGEIAARIEGCGDSALAPLRALRDRAVRELKVEPAREREFYEPATYAPRGGAAHRVPVDPESEDAAEKRGLFKPWD